MISLNKIKNPKFLLPVAIIVVLAIVGIYFAFNGSQDEPIQNNTNQEQEAVETEPVAEESAAAQTEKEAEQPAEQPKPVNSGSASKWPVQLSSTQAGYLEVVVNKKYKLPSNYVPSLTSAGGGQLRPEAAVAYNKLIAGAKSAGVNLVFLSGYRSYSYQSTLYNNYVARDGQAAADTYSARPGHSEHQTGLTVDVGDGGGCDLEACFGDRAAGKWVAANAHKYGFILRYPKSKESITGYTYEPWHLRYIGENTAASVYSSGKVLEEYYGVEGGGY